MAEISVQQPVQAAQRSVANFIVVEGPGGGTITFWDLGLAPLRPPTAPGAAEGAPGPSWSRKTAPDTMSGDRAASSCAIPFPLTETWLAAERKASRRRRGGNPVGFSSAVAACYARCVWCRSLTGRRVQAFRSSRFHQRERGFRLAGRNRAAAVPQETPRRQRAGRCNAASPPLTGNAGQADAAPDATSDCGQVVRFASPLASRRSGRTTDYSAVAESFGNQRFKLRKVRETIRLH
jgi:hypothetical protein